MPTLYAYPKLLNCGLAHELITWARCAAWCERTGATMIAPIWSKPRLGPWIRGERDKRLYGRFFHDPRMLYGLARIRALLFGRVKVFATEHDGSLPYLPEIRGLGSTLRRRLEQMTRPQYRPSPSDRPFIAVHVRRGDFFPFSEDRLARGEGNIRTPIDWFVDRLVRLREQLGEQTPAVIYSDGTDEDLAPLLALPNVRRSANEAITDLLEMTDAAAIIGSGSGFSILAALLGNVPRLSHPGQRLAFALDDEAAEIEVAKGEDMPESFIELILDRLQKQSLAA